MATQRALPNEPVHAALQRGMGKPHEEISTELTLVSPCGNTERLKLYRGYAVIDDDDAAWRKTMRAERLAQRQEDQDEAGRRLV